MATYYLDPAGNDANDGTSFANRKRTLTAFSAAILAPGDTIRLIASPDPATPGNATWTDNSGTVTWAAAKNLVIDNCETNWTASANVTCALSTSTKKQGTNAQTITPATGFTTGKLAYRTLPATLDLSAFEQVSLWIQQGFPATAGQLELKLCSDTTGDTPVNTLSIPLGEFGQWTAAVINNAGALGASIASIALYCTADPGTFAIRLDNIVACKAAASADCVTHQHVVGKNTGGEPDWYAIQSIDDSSVILGGARTIAGTTAPRPYRGTSETVATYTLLGLPAWSTTEHSVTDSGTEAAPIVISGGWNRTDMSTQTGVSYFNGGHFHPCAINAGPRSFISISKVGGLLMAEASVKCTGASHLSLDLEQSVGCQYGAYYTSGAPAGSQRIKFDAIQGMTNAAGAMHTEGSDIDAEFIGRRIHGSVGSSALTLMPRCRYAVDKIDNNTGNGINLLYFTTGSVKFPGTTFANNGANIAWGGGPVTLVMDGATLAAPTLSNDGERLKVSRFGGAANDHRVFAKNFLVASATDQRHTASGISWKVSPTDATNCNSRNPAEFCVGRIAVSAGALVTVKCWMRRDSTGISAGLRIPASSFPGVGTSKVETLMTAAIDTWEEITLTFTPTVAGVVEVLGVAWGGTTFNAWFDDLTVTQA